MNEEEKRSLIERYISAYNTFDIDSLMSVVHPDVEFKNVAGGEVNAATSGADEFRALAEWSKSFFTSRRQTITEFETEGDQASIEVDFEAVLAADLPNGMKAGETMRLTGRSEFTFRDGMICEITDIS